MQFSLLHPCRSRVEKSWHCLSEWITRAGIDLEVIISIDANDPRKGEFIAQYEGFTVIVNENDNAVMAVNAAARVATGDIMIVVSDDFACPKEWGKMIERAVRGRRDFVLKVADGIQPYLVTLPILDRAYYNRFGYIYDPRFRHMFSDTAFTHVADLLGRLVYRQDLLFPHRHYSVIKGALKDEVTRRADATFDEGKRIYLDMVRENFGLTRNALDIANEEHKQWLKRNL